MHGGLSPELKSVEQIKRIPRPTDVPDTGLLCDLLWADPDKDRQGWGENDRGVSYTFGADSVLDFLSKHDLDLICRAHQVRFSVRSTGALSVNSRGILGISVSSDVCHDMCCRYRLLRMDMSSLPGASWSPFLVLQIIAASSTMLEP
jgi:hypothetical protein